MLETVYLVFGSIGLVAIVTAPLRTRRRWSTALTIGGAFLGSAGFAGVLLVSTAGASSWESLFGALGTGAAMAAVAATLLRFLGAPPRT